MISTSGFTYVYCLLYTHSPITSHLVRHLGTLPWKVEMKYCRRNTDTLCLSTILGNGWLSDDHINMMMEEYSQEAESNAEVKARIIIAPLALAGEIRKNGKTGTYGKKEAPLLWLYENTSKRKGLRSSFSQCMSMTTIGLPHLWISRLARLAMVSHDFEQFEGF